MDRYLSACALTVAALLLLCSIVRMLCGNVAGAISLILLSLYPKLSYSSLFESATLFCLVAPMWLLVRCDWKQHKNDLALSLGLAALVALGALANILILSISPVVAFGFALLRYVPVDSLRPYFDLRHSLRLDSRAALRDIAVIVVGPWLLLAPRLPRTISSIALPSSLPFLQASDPLVPIATLTTLWWLFVSIRSGSGLPFSLTAIPTAYLLAGSLCLNLPSQRANPIYPIVLANLITLIGLWLRGRRNKRVLDSTQN